jgi:hypothetical protein
MPRETDRGDADWLHDAAQRAEKDSNPHISYATIISALAFAASVVYGAWALNQSQLANINAQIELLRKETSDKAAVLAAELARRENEIKISLANMQSKIDRGPNEFVPVQEQREFRDRVLDDIRGVRAQLNVLEQTRPTTGELSAVSLYVKDQTARLEERVRQLEQNSINHAMPPGMR